MTIHSNIRQQPYHLEGGQRDNSKASPSLSAPSSGMLDFATSTEHMAHQHGMMGYPSQNHQQQADNYFMFPDPCSSSARQNFSLNAPPLAALHSMTDIKSPQTSSSSTLNNYNTQAYAYSMKNYLNGTPHGISDILSRPDLHQQLQARLGQGVYYNSCSQASPISPATPTKLSPDVTNRSLYWPSNGSVLPSTQSSCWSAKQGGLSHAAVEKEGKKKNTRPTFSGSQIFALEKTFEQQKYLAGPERGRLAYALGMTESQVKVWFQNRRTKWRKKHAAELAASKRRVVNPADSPVYDPEQSNDRNRDGSLYQDSDNMPQSSDLQI